MNIEQQVTSLELSRELKENGYPQEGLWWWMPTSKGEYTVTNEASKNGFKALGWFKDVGVVIAPTVAELGEALPVQFNDFGWYDLKIHKCMAKWEIEYIKYNMNDNNCLVEGDYYFKVKDKSLADCMAKTWLYLKKNGLLEAQDE